ncbi:MAG: ABC transporter substrate-binding protein [Thermodesulfovibrionia bacterium]|nr:ABC transporter substrate-binding protein [Thermodesulfovibrionia bacterium]
MIKKEKKLGVKVIGTFLGITFVLLTFLFISGCDLSKQSGKNEAPKKKVSLRLRWIPQSQFAGIYWAQEKGLFAKEGLDVTIVPGGPGINIMQLIGSGAEDMGICASAQVIEARDKGLPVVSVGTIFQSNPNIFFAKTESGITSPKDWVGKTVAVFKGYDQEYVFRALLKRQGIDPKSVKEYPAQIDMNPFFEDKVEVWSGYVINQPNTAEEKGFKINRIYPDKYGVHISGDGICTSEEFIQNQPEIVGAVTRAVLTGWKEALSNRKEAVDIMLKVNPKLDRVHEEKMINSVAELSLTDDINGKIGWMKEQQWQEMIDLWKEFGGIKNDMKAASCYTMKFLEEFYGQEPKGE